jgi:alpha-beta hydrolase superfamily lysophospholipase
VSSNGVHVRALGEGGQYVFVVPGLEGSGESCLHLAVPVVQRAVSAGHGLSVALIDYAQEQHRTFEDLAETVRGLIREVAGDSPCVLWGQSFGNLLVANTAAAHETNIDRLVMVSPFISLPRTKVRIGVALMSVTPHFVYRVSGAVPSRILFGPVGDRANHPFFAALQRQEPRDAARRIAWLSRVFDRDFAAASQPTCVWLGAADRLVDLATQRAYFEAQAVARRNYRLRIVSGAGHVFLPTQVVSRVHGELLECLLAPIT